MKKLMIGAACSLILSGGGLLSAEENGVFVGVSYQGGQTYMSEKADVDTTLMKNPVNHMGLDTKKDKFLNGAGLKIGYKQFFGQSKWFGLRYYAFLDYGYSSFGGLIPKNLDKPDFSDTVDYKAHMLSYGVGIDTLWNFVNKENFNFGLFAGVGLGADTWIANGKDFQEKYFPKGKPAYASFQTTIDVGLRTNIHKHHGLEVGVKVPLLQDRIFADKDDTYDYKIPLAPVSAQNLANNTTDMHRLYSVYVSYLYTF